jgi:hypothetical protein
VDHGDVWSWAVRLISQCLIRDRSSSSLTVLFRKANHLKPELVDRPDDGRDLAQVDGLRHVRIGVPVVALYHVLLRLRAREDDDRNAAQIGVGLDLFQQFVAAFSGQVEVEQDQVRTRPIGRPSVLAGVVAKAS